MISLNEILGEVTLEATPGFWYAVAYVLSNLLWIIVLPKRRVWWKIAIVNVFVFLAMAYLMVQTTGSTGWIFAGVMIACLSMLFMVQYYSCELTCKSSVYFVVNAFIFAEFMTSFAWQLYYYSVKQLHISENIRLQIGFILIAYVLCLILNYRIAMRNRLENPDMILSMPDCIAAVTIGLSIYLFSNISYVLKNTPFSVQYASEIFIIRTLVDLAGIILLYAHHLQISEINAKTENRALQNMLYNQSVNYQMSEESIAIVNQKYHDLKHQIALLRSEISKDEKLTYLDQMEQEIHAYEAQNKTGNKILDTVLTGKSLYCQSQHISMTCVADGSALDFIAGIDLGALFGNALDNAIESVKKIENPEKRLIHVSVSTQKNFVRIKIENCYEGEIKFKNNLPQTSKREKAFHGYGVKSIKNIAEKYGGSITISANKGWFELRILIPIPRKEKE